MDFEQIKKVSEGYRADMTRFLREMISYPSESCEEKEVVACIKREMEKLGYDEVEVDGLGNVIGWMGQGDKIIAIDSHIDTVGIGNINNWTHDPYKGYEDDEVIYCCHGSAPERGDNAIYKMADILQDVRALNENDDADDKEVKGLVKMLNPKYNPEHYEDARFLGRGTCTTSQIFYTSPSRCAVADSCSISIDRRMTAGETWDSCLQEIRDLPSVKKYGDDVKVSMYMYDRPSWTGEVYETEAYFPTWINKENAAHVQALVDAHHALFGEERIGPEGAMHLRHRPLIDKWTFSTNGVSIQGRYGIPCVGFGPGAESQAHAPNEITWKQDLVTCAALYAAVPGLYKEENKTADVSQFRAGKTNNDIK